MDKSEALHGEAVSDLPDGVRPYEIPRQPETSSIGAALREHQKDIEWAVTTGEVHVRNLRTDEMQAMMSVVGMLQRRRRNEQREFIAGDRLERPVDAVSVSGSNGQ